MTDLEKGGMDRRENLRKLKAESFDLLIIGGGITGAGIALDAASRGLKTALLEKLDFASGTSSRSTKLIHGGLRYLKQFEFALVREVGRERAILHENAPHLVIPEKMLLPVVKGGTYGKWGVSLGLWLYDLLAGVKKSERRKMLSRSQTLKIEPLIRQDILKGAGIYTEYRTDDARLTIEVIKTAGKKGAVAANYAEVTGFEYDDQGKITGAVATDMLTGESFTVHARQIVNAAGPWVDLVRKKDNSLKGKRLHHTKGVHLVVPHDRLPINNSVYFDVEGGRMIFAIPRGNTTYIGTTDTNFKGNLEEPGVTQQDIDYLLKAANDMFPGVNLTPGDIISNWSGIRPLIHEDGKSPSELSRKDEIFYADSGLITIAGGKLTGFRKMAERVTDVVMKRMVEAGIRKEFVACQTGDIELTGGAVPDNDPDQLVEALSKGFELEKADIRRVVEWFGSEAKTVLAAVDSREDPGAAVFDAVMEFCVAHEMTVNLIDLFVRRTGLLYFDPQKIEEYLNRPDSKIGTIFGWSDAQLEKEIVKFKNYSKAHFSTQPA